MGRVPSSWNAARSNEDSKTSGSAPLRTKDLAISLSCTLIDSDSITACVQHQNMKDRRAQTHLASSLNNTQYNPPLPPILAPKSLLPFLLKASVPVALWLRKTSLTRLKFMGLCVVQLQPPQKCQPLLLLALPAALVEQVQVHPRLLKTFPKIKAQVLSLVEKHDRINIIMDKFKGKSRYCWTA